MKMVTLKLAYRNLFGAGLRTWLNVFVLSLAYVIIIWHQGFFSGMLRQGTHDMIKDEAGGGQYWEEHYDPYDAISLDDSHGIVPEELKALIDEKKATPILIRPAAIFPEGRVQSVLLKGIDPSQKILDIPSIKLARVDDSVIPVLVGRRMAKNNSFKVGDYITIRLRDAKGTFDAVEGEIVSVMNTNVPTIDNGQLWIPIEKLEGLTLLKGEATMVVVKEGVSGRDDIPGWSFKDQAFLLKDIYEVVRGKRVGSSIMYGVLLLLAMLAIFDTQVLAVFRRRKEIGTLIALGMTRARVIALFTLEGMLNGILAIAVGAVYGIPLIVFTAKKGLSFPEVIDSYGLAIAHRLFPYYPVGLIVTTVLIVMIAVTIVSFLPPRKIARMKPTEALKGKMS